MKGNQRTKIALSNGSVSNWR